MSNFGQVRYKADTTMVDVTLSQIDSTKKQGLMAPAFFVAS